MAEPFIGEIRMFAGNFAPSGWAKCDGASVAITDNETLFALIGTIYGGDGVNTFNLPDMRGRVPVHAGQGTGLSNYNLGNIGGVENVALNESQLPVHSHLLQCKSGAATSSSPAGKYLARPSAGAAYKGTTNTVAMAAATMPAAPASNAHSNIGPFQAVNFIIALFGVFPSQN